MQVNILTKMLSSTPCSRCNSMIGDAKAKMCCACGESVHVACLKSKPGIGYWMCDDCAPKFRHGHEDAALNIPLHKLLRGLDYYPGADSASRDQLRASYKFVRGCLVWASHHGDVIIPPPCLRDDII